MYNGERIEEKEKWWGEEGRERENEDKWMPSRKASGLIH